MQKFTTIGDWTLRLLLAVLFVAQGVIKVGGSPTWVSRFREWGYPDHLYMVIGVVELLAGIALLIPRFAAFGAVVLIVVMAGATGTHMVHREPQSLTTILLLALLAAILVIQRVKLRGRNPNPV